MLINVYQIYIHIPNFAKCDRFFMIQSHIASEQKCYSNSLILDLLSCLKMVLTVVPSHLRDLLHISKVALIFPTKCELEHVENTTV